MGAWNTMRSPRRRNVPSLSAKSGSLSLPWRFSENYGYERSLHSPLTPILKVRLTNCPRTLILPGPWDPEPGIFEASLRE
jgi:hypothetical protein